MQLSHYDTNFPKKAFPITILADNLKGPYNIGGLFRISEAFGVACIVFGGEVLEFGQAVKRSSRSTDKLVKFKVSHDLKTDLNRFKKYNHQIVGLEITSTSIPISQLKLTLEKPIALIIGNENFGISPDLLELCDTVCHITMFGLNSSMNVTQATGIALYEITNQLQNSIQNTKL